MEEKELEEEFWKTVKSGMFWEWFPELSGVWEKDREEYIATKKRWNKVFSERKKLDETPVVQGDAYVSGGADPLNSGSAGKSLIVSDDEVSYSNKKTGYEKLPFPELVDELVQYYKDESPYCRICKGCGEDGCCSAATCEMHKGGMYCETYLRDLKFGYLMYRDMYKKFKRAYPKKLKKIYKINFDLIYKEDNE